MFHLTLYSHLSKVGPLSFLNWIVYQNLIGNLKFQYCWVLREIKNIRLRFSNFLIDRRHLKANRLLARKFLNSYSFIWLDICPHPEGNKTVVTKEQFFF